MAKDILIFGEGHTQDVISYYYWRVIVVGNGKASTLPLFEAQNVDSFWYIVIHEIS